MGDDTTGLREALWSVGLETGDTVLVHSSMSGMACRPRTFLETLRDVLGEDGTVVAPTFTPTYRHASPDGTFVLDETPSEVGHFTELVRAHPDAERNVDPTHSFATLGARADELGSCHARSTYDRANVLGRLHDLEAEVLAVGLEPFGRSMTFFHYVEGQAGIPRQEWNYRMKKSYPGTVVIGEKAIDYEHVIHTQDYERNVTYDFAPLGEMLVEEGLTDAAHAANKTFVRWNTAEAYDPLADIIVNEPERVYSVGEK